MRQISREKRAEALAAEERARRDAVLSAAGFRPLIPAIVVPVGVTITKKDPASPWWTCLDCGELRRNLGAPPPLPALRVCAACKGAREDRVRFAPENDGFRKVNS